jgi:hypothetical protein
LASTGNLSEVAVPDHKRPGDRGDGSAQGTGAEPGAVVQAPRPALLHDGSTILSEPLAKMDAALNRIAAYKKLGRPTIPAIIFDDDEIDAEMRRTGARESAQKQTKMVRF